MFSVPQITQYQHSHQSDSQHDPS